MDLCNKCLSGPYTSQETMRKNTNSKPVTHTAIRQVNIVTVKLGLLPENILEALMGKRIIM